MKTNLNKNFIHCFLYNTDNTINVYTYVKILRKNGFEISGNGELYNPYIITFNKLDIIEEFRKIYNLLDEMPISVIPENSHAPYVLSIYLDDEYKKQHESEKRIFKELLKRAKETPENERSIEVRKIINFYEYKKGWV